MISIVKSDGELDTKTETNEENQSKTRVSGDGMESEAISRVLENNGSTGEVNEAIMVGHVDKKEEEEEEEEEEESSRVFEVKNERTPPSFVQFDLKNDRFAPQDDELDDAKNDDQMEHSGGGDNKVEVYSSLLSEFDDFVANEKHGAMEGACRALSYGFEVGDMVWGKVKSHPWWPGHIFNEVFASSSCTLKFRLQIQSAPVPNPIIFCLSPSSLYTNESNYIQRKHKYKNSIQTTRNSKTLDYADPVRKEEHFSIIKTKKDS